MKHQVVLATGLLILSMQAEAFLQNTAQSLPLKNGRPAVAVVGGDPIYLDEVVRERGASANRQTLQQGRGSADDFAVLDRLVTIKLITQEARRMGLSEVPDIEKQVTVTSREIQREVLMERLVKDVTADAAAVDKIYKEAVREWKTTALIFQDRAAAANVQKELASGATFADVSARAVAAKTAKTDVDNAYHPKQDYLPQIANALATLQVGQVSGAIPLQVGFVVVKVVDIRYPEDAQARAVAKKQVLDQQRVVFLKAHEQVLRRQYAVVNTTLLKSINYEASKPTIETLLKDKRVIVDIKGAAPVTVGDLTDYLRMQYYHGPDQPAQRKRMNARKDDALDATLGRRLLNLEAQKLGIDKTAEYRDRVTGYKESLVFDAFVQKVIAPENKVKEDEVKQYYNAHLKDYSTPGMLRLRSLAFTRRTAAEDAIKKLREGTDLNWLASNASDRAASGTPGLLVFDGKQPILSDSMPAGLQKVLTGAKAGEYKVYGSPEGVFYVIVVQQVLGSAARPYAEAREEAAQKLFAEKIKKGVDTYAAKLKTQSKVEVYLVRVK